jgi:foldase protein PrsA
MEGYKDQYQKTIDNYKSFGIKEATFLSVYKNEILKKKLLAEITADQPASEEQAWARHILVETEAEAQDAYASLIAGADFAELAKQISKDTGSGAQGGDLGWFGKGQMVAEFETAAFSQPIGEIGEPVQSQFGYHIIQVLDRQELPISESKLQQNRETAFSEWLTTIRDGAKITRFDEVWKANIPPAPETQTTQQ